MTVVRRSKMCRDCPWRRTSSPGWLGASGAMEFLVANDRAEGDMPCHMSVDYTDKAWKDKLDDATMCVGGQHFNANSAKMPRDPALRAARDHYGPSDEVFDSFPEFLEHHDNELNVRYRAEEARLEDGPPSADTLGETG